MLTFKDTHVTVRNGLPRLKEFYQRGTCRVCHRGEQVLRWKGNQESGYLVVADHEGPRGAKGERIGPCSGGGKSPLAPVWEQRRAN